MKYEDYKEYYDLISKLKKLYDDLEHYNYKGDNIELDNYSNGIVEIMKKECDNAKLILERINHIKERYEAHQSSDNKKISILKNNYYLAYLVDAKSNVRLYKDDAALVYPFENYSTIVDIYSESGSFIIAYKKKNQNGTYYDCRMISELYSPSLNEDYLFYGVKKWFYLNENILIFEFEDHVSIFDRVNRKVLVKNVDSIKPLDNKVGNYYPGKNYLVEKVLHFEKEDITLSFFIDNTGNVVSDLMDSNFTIYGIKDRDNKKNIDTNLENLFDFVKRDYKDNGYKVVLKKVK